MTGSDPIKPQPLKPKIIVICGPTASGKTAVAVEAASRLNGEIINADSMQIYRYMDIGTAKPTASEQGRVRHHLIDILNPDEPFSAALYAVEARKRINSLHLKEIIPFVVGGTGLYIKALLKGLFPARPVDPTLRSRLKKEALDHGLTAMHQRLAICDPEAARRIHPNDSYRIMRALEIYESTGDSITRFQAEHGFEDQPFSVLKIGLEVDRPKLYERIDTRVDEMISAGLLQEVQRLLDSGFSSDLKSMQSIGYCHLAAVIQGRLSWSEAVRTFKRDTRRYAKRQLTWFQADSEINWIAADDTTAMLHLIDGFLKTESYAS